MFFQFGTNPVINSMKIKLLKFIILNLENADLKDLAKYCDKPCGAILKCGHMCKGICGKCWVENEHVKCDEIMSCGHE